MFASESPRREIRWPVLRVEPGVASEVVLLAGGWLRLDTHYFKRTQICLGSDDCPVCQYLPSRSYYYLPGVFSANRRPVLLELSPLAAADLEQVAKLLGRGVRSGLRLRVRRRTAKAPMKFEALEDGARVGEVETHEWVSAVMAIYGFDAMKPNEGVVHYRERLADAARARCERLAAELSQATLRSRNGAATR